MKTCKECPYKKDSLPGYLGELSHNPERFLDQLESPHLHPCHLTVNWEDEDGGTENAKTCTGALQYMNNTCKVSRYPQARQLQNTVGKSEKIFNRRTDFIKHHSK